MNIYVGNVKYEMTGDQLKEMFSAYGEVSSARIISDRETGRSKGFGFVEMPNDSEAKAAIEATNEKEIGGRSRIVAMSFCEPRSWTRVLSS